MLHHFVRPLLRVALLSLLLLLVSTLGLPAPRTLAAAGPVQVKDIVPGSGGSNLHLLGNVNGTLFFTADDGSSGQELWKSDGTAGGTIQVQDINPGSVRSDPKLLTNVNGTLFFTATDGTSARQLWKSDGTAAGTILVKDIIPGSGSSYLAYLTDVNGTLFFEAYDGISGQELWKSDGTTAGTVQVKDINPSGYSDPNSLTNVNGTLFFTANDGTSGNELWKSDGTAAGTVQVKDINPSGSSNPYNLMNMNGTLFFNANDGTNGIELWKSDGTVAGTVQVKDINSNGSSNPYDLMNVNGTLFFTANDGSSGYELWKSDGTAAGTVQVKDINPGSGDATLGFMANMNGMLFFTADNGTTGQELWSSDGTTAGTVLVKDIRPGPRESLSSWLIDVNGTLVFAADDGSSGYELWTSDGTAAGTVLLKDINPGSNTSAPGSLTTMNGTLFFAANDGTNGAELWSFTPPVPHLTVSGNSQPISAGATTPTTANHTDYGTSLVGQAIIGTFTITNSGEGPLLLTDRQRVALSGAAASDFSLTLLPTTPVASSGSTTFQITWTPSGLGIRSATVSIASNDSSANLFTFAIQGTSVQASQKITFAALADKTVGDAPFSLSAIASSGLPVSFNTSTPSVCIVSGNTAMLVAAGTCTIVADQAGNTSYSAAPLVAQSFTVQPASSGTMSQTITFAAVADKTVGDAPFSLNATASSGLPISFSTSTPSVCMVNGSTATLVAAGTCTIIAAQAGNASYSAALPVTQSFTVQPASNIVLRLYIPLIIR